MLRNQSSLLSTVRDTIGYHLLLNFGEKVLVAVSGGVDSMVLLDVLSSLEELRLELVIVHLNHLLRGEESDRDEEFVRAAAVRYGFPCFVERVDVRVLAQLEKRSLEDAGREARHRFLERVLRMEGADAVALAHHLDDQAETVLMRLLRGSGTSGLTGMRPRSGWKVRPLFDVTRQQIVDYAVSRNIEFREDNSNMDRRFLRNRIRHELLPLLQTYNPLISRTLGTTAAILAVDDEALAEMTESRFEELAAATDGEITFPVAELLYEPDAVRYRLYRYAIRRLIGNLQGISHRHLLDVDRLLLCDSPSCSVSLPRSLRVGRVYGTLRFTLETNVTFASEVMITDFGVFPVAGGSLQVVLAEASFSRNSFPHHHLLFDLDSVPFPWTVRTFRDGDRMIPFGMTGSRKLKDVFIDLKVPRHRRREIPVICDRDGSILAVLGVRRSALAPVSVATRRTVQMIYVIP